MSAAQPEPFTCEECVRLSRAHNAPPGEAWDSCTRCGHSTRRYVGVVMAGASVLTTATFYAWIDRYGERVPDTPGVRVVGGVELYSAGWLN